MKILGASSMASFLKAVLDIAWYASGRTTGFTWGSTSAWRRSRCLAYLYILFNLRRVFLTLRQGNPFVLGNASRLRRVGLAVCLVPPLSWLLDVTVVRGRFSVLGEPLVTAIFPRESLPLVFLGLVILVIAEVVRLGVVMSEGYENLRREQELTV